MSEWSSIAFFAFIKPNKGSNHHYLSIAAAAAATFTGGRGVVMNSTTSPWLRTLNWGNICHNEGCVGRTISVIIRIDKEIKAKMID